MMTTMPPTKQILNAIHALRAIRRDLHAHPELGFEEHRTASLIAEELSRLEIPHHVGIGRTGVVGVIEGRSNCLGRSVGLRADMDALPLQELTGLAHQSRCSGRMHACGHDGHITMLLAAARYLQHTREFDGTVYLIFQPGEEGCGGGRAMVEDGLFERFPADRLYALHNWPGLPLGTVSIPSGPVMAATDRIRIRIRGHGGHGGVAPHRTVDPVLVAGHLIVAAHSIVSRNIDPLEAAAISLCAIQGGDLERGFAVIPEEVVIVGTARSLRPEVQDLIERRLQTVVQSVAESFGATATLEYERVFPATINSAEEAQFARSVAAELLGADKIIADPRPSLGGEDFAYMLQQRPGAYIHLGSGSDVGLHNPHFDFNDELIPIGGALLARLAERALPSS
ncbi:hippurate hydrolase [Burkholderia sp. GAS332]|nr:hippurate hydrolase [Burkholderia sp. GAS332]